MFRRNKISGPVEYLIVGLGNPDRKYENTRHNCGWLAADYIAGKLGVSVNKIKFKSFVGECTVGGRRALLMKPTTYMNNSGQAVAEAMRFYKIPPEKVILVDDMIDTAGTLCNAANAIVEKGGATEVYACATHAVLSGPAVERIKNSAIKEVILLDTIPVPEEKMIDKFTVLPTAPIFAEAIARIYNDKPFTAAFA